MNKNKPLSMVAVLAAMTLASCQGNPPSSSNASSQIPSSGSEPSLSSETSVPSSELPLPSSEDSVGPIVEKKEYNIILAAATLPPVLGALNSIESGNETYAWIERGKTYAGIEMTSFHNLGFDPSNNTNYGITDAGYKATIAKVKELKEATPDAFFNFYVTDYKVLSGVKVAVEAGLGESSWHINMASDGSATSEEYVKRFIKGKDDSSSYTDFTMKFFEAETLISDAFSSFGETGESVLNQYKNEYTEGYERCIPLSVDPRFTLLSQVDLSTVTPEGWSLHKVFSTDEEFDVKAYVDYSTIDTHVASLNDEQKNEYLTLMFGSSRAEIDRQFNRKTLDDGVTAVPEKKLVYIGGRIRQSSVGVISSIATNFTRDYAALDPEFHQVFENEADFLRFYDFLHDETNWKSLFRRKKETADAGTFVPSAIDVSVLDAAQKSDIILALTNYYLNYAWNLNFSYRLYGGEYDILFKGHPREDFSLVDNDSWNYTTPFVQAEDGKFYCIDYKQLAHDLIEDFYLHDSIGSHIGLMPFGVAAENLVYVGPGVSFGGLLSSTYSGLSNDTPIVFLLANDESNATLYDQVASKYEAFGLTWNAGTEEEVKTTYFNKANIALAQMNYYEGKEDIVSSTLFAKYKAVYDRYVGEGQSIDCFGVIS